MAWMLAHVAKIHAVYSEAARCGLSAQEVTEAVAVAAARCHRDACVQDAKGMRPANPIGYTDMVDTQRPKPVRSPLTPMQNSMARGINSCMTGLNACRMRCDSDRQQPYAGGMRQHHWQHTDMDGD
jgi:hypothetical protein